MRDHARHALLIALLLPACFGSGGSSSDDDDDGGDNRLPGEADTDTDSDTDTDTDTDSDTDSDTDADYEPDYDDSTCSGSLLYGEWEATSDDGIIDASVELPEGRSFILTAEADGSDVYLMASYAIDPDGYEVYDWEDWNGAEEHYTYAAFPIDGVVNFNYPVRDNDRDLADGIWDIELYAIDGDGYYVNGETVAITAHLAEDEDVTEGCLYVRVTYADDVDDNAEVVEAVEAAMARWNEVFLDVDIKMIPTAYDSSSIDPDVPAPSEGHSRYETIAENGYTGELHMIIGETVDGETDTLGQSGGIPGAITPTPRSAVAISWLLHAGTNGSFSKAEIKDMGETMAHEAGHYMGLFHPVEFEGSTPYAFDALSDTPECSGFSDCEDEMAENLMFPYATCGPAECDQDQLTSDQTGVLNRYTGTL